MTDETLKEITEYFKIVTNYNPTDFIREDLGVFNFQEIIPTIENIINLYKKIKPEMIFIIPHELQDTLKEDLANTQIRFNKILDFAPTGKDKNIPEQHKKTIIDNINNHYDKIFPHITQLLPAIIDWERAITFNIAEVQLLMEKLRKDKENASKIMDGLRKDSAEKGVTKQVEYFNTACRRYFRRSWYWLGTVVLLSIVLIGFSISALWFTEWLPKYGINLDEKYQYIQLIISKFFVFSVLSFFLYMAAKNYNSMVHNEILNRHRVNALSTFETLVNAAKEIENKDIILNHAASCIFSPQQTGYSKDSNIKSPFPSSILNLLTKKTPESG